MTGLPKWKQQLPNAITWFRICVVPVIIAVLSINQDGGGLIAAVLFIIASLSDYFDGMLARRWGVVSDLGKFLDPIADKILVTTTLIMLIPSQRLDIYMVIIIIARDILVDGLRSVAAIERVVIPAGALGKWKTAIQMVAIPAVLIHRVFGFQISRLGYLILWISVFLSVASGVDYFLGYLKRRRAKKTEAKNAG